MSILDPSEEEIFNKPAIYEKKKVSLILSNVRLVIAEKKTIIKEMNYHLIDKIKYTKKDDEKADEKTSVKFRILDAQENKLDISFKGVNSIEDLKSAVKILKQKKAEADNEYYGNQEATSDHKDKSDLQLEGYLFAKEEPPEESKLKAKIFKQNPIVFDVYKRLSDQNVTNDETFWVNFKSQLANQLSLEQYQQSGYSGRFLSEVDADVSKSRGNQFSYTLDDNIKRQILRKKPRVAEKLISFLKEKEKPSKKDPDPMTREEADIYFWQQYFAAGLRDTNPIKKTDKKERNIFDTISTKDTVRFVENSRIKRAKSLELSVRVGSLYESINPIGNSAYSCGCGQGIFNKELLPQLLQEVIDSYNIHSELSLIDNKIIPDTTREINDQENDGNQKTPLEPPLYISPTLEDLLPSKEINYDSLSIVNAVAKPPSEEIDPSTFHDEAQHFSDVLNAFNDSFKLSSPPQPQKKEAEIILRDMTGDTTSFYNYNKINSQRSLIYTGLDEMRKHKIEEQILLFLFWSNYLNPKADQEKIDIILGEIRKLKESLTLEKKRISNLESNNALGPLYEEMDDSLDQVLNLFNNQANAPQANALPTNFDDYQFF